MTSPPGPVRHLSDYLTEDLLHQPDWRQARRAEARRHDPARAPVLLYHSNGDEILPTQMSVDLRAKWCVGGANVTFWRTDTSTHFVTAAVMSPSVTGWVADRLSGSVPTGNC